MQSRSSFDESRSKNMCVAGLLGLDTAWLRYHGALSFGSSNLLGETKRSSEERDVPGTSHMLPPTCLSFLLLCLPDPCEVPGLVRTLCGLHSTRLQAQPAPSPCSSFRQLHPDVCALSWPGRMLTAGARMPSSWCHQTPRPHPPTSADIP